MPLTTREERFTLLEALGVEHAGALYPGAGRARCQKFCAGFLCALEVASSGGRLRFYPGPRPWRSWTRCAAWVQTRVLAWNSCRPWLWMTLWFAPQTLKAYWRGQRVRAVCCLAVFTVFAARWCMATGAGQDWVFPRPTRPSVRLFLLKGSCHPGNPRRERSYMACRYLHRAQAHLRRKRTYRRNLLLEGGRDFYGQVMRLDFVFTLRGKAF